jgi:hypothetical protein
VRPHKRSDAELEALQVGPSGQRGAERSEGSAVNRKSKRK